MATGTRAIDELSELLAPAGRALARAAPRIVLGFALLVTLLAGFALLGAARDDATITADQAVARAQVLDGSTFFRTLVQFTAADGQAHTPELGVFYPRGLAPGTTVTVEYDVANPDLVRVAGRTALVGGPALGAAVALAWVLALPLAHRLRRRSAPG